MDAKKFGLLLPKRKENCKVKGKSVFDNSSDEELPVNKQRPKIPQSKPSSSKIMKSEIIDDPSIYEYDNIYDEMKEKQKAELLPKEKKTSRYIDNLLKAADKRKKQHERRVEKKVQLEREKEGDKFKDKEAFVTSAYKKKMLEMEEEEEKERRENLINDMMDVTKQKDLSGFYRHFLNQTVGDENPPNRDHPHPIKQEPLSEGEFDTDKKSDSEIKTGNYKVKKRTSQDENSKSEKIKKCRFTYEKGHDEKQNQITRQRHDSSSNSSDESTIKDISSKRDDKVHHKKSETKKRYRNRKNSDSSSNEEINIEQPKTLDNNLYKKTEMKEKCDHSNESDSSNDSSEDDIKSDEVKPESSDKKSVLSVSNEESKSLSDDREATQRNLFKKRTVGSMFDEAQTRYFMRLAARNGTA